MHMKKLFKSYIEIFYNLKYFIALCKDISMNFFRYVLLHKVIQADILCIVKFPHVEAVLASNCNMQTFYHLLPHRMSYVGRKK